MKRALVLSGGGSKGAYQAGALKHLIVDQGRRYDVVSGVSVGALNGSLLCQYKKENQDTALKELVGLWREIDTKSIYKKWFAWPVTVPWEKSVYNSKPLSKIINEKLDTDMLYRSDVDFYMGVVSLNNGTISYKTNRNKNVLKYIEASAAFPVMLTPVQIGEQWYTDGGIRDVTPLKIAIEVGGVDEVDVILAQDRYLISNIKKPKVTQDAPRILGIMMNEIIENDLKIAQLYNESAIKSPKTFREKRFVKINVIRPNGKLPYSSLDFDHDRILQSMEYGYRDAKEYFSEE